MGTSQEASAAQRVTGTRVMTEEMERDRWILENDFKSRIGGASVGSDVGMLGRGGNQGVWLE